MRTPMVAGNWKMNKTAEQAKALVTELLPGLKAGIKVERVLCPTFTCLSSVYELVKDTNIGLGAQNLHWEASGAYTGEISASRMPCPADMAGRSCHGSSAAGAVGVDVTGNADSAGLRADAVVEGVGAGERGERDRTGGS